MSDAGKLLACVYTCEAHRHLLARFHDSEVGKLLRDTAETDVVEVYADPNIPRSIMDSRRMLLKCDESYFDLTNKTHRMIEFAVHHFRFDSLLKIDITTVLNQSELGTPEYTERKAMDMAAIADFLRKADYSQDYLGFKQHAKAGREGVENWAMKKGLAIDYTRLFGDGPVPPYYTGKCYVLSRRFAEFIARSGAEMASEQRQYLPGSEDVMIGRLYERFKSAGLP
jgi:hypothetical protein